MIAIISYGLLGLFTTDGAVITALLGNYSKVWNMVLIIGGLLAVISLYLDIPKSFVLTMIAMGLLAVGSGSVLGGIIAYYGKFYFAGSTSLYIFLIGSICRAVQVRNQLTRIRREITHMQAMSNES